MANLNAKHVKSTGSYKQNSGRHKRTGYAATSPDQSVISTVPGLLPGKPYAGPNVAQQPRGAA
jgi:hypothetical protein